jgi:hypothetical protein
MAGCPLREVCDIYKGKYSGSPLFSPDYRRHCDTVTEIRLSQNFCSYYDDVSLAVSTLSESAGGPRKSTESIMDALKRAEKAMKS